jgi:excisionase family DNA binding protein
MSDAERELASRFITTVEAAAFLGVANGTLHRWIASGKLDALTFGQTHVVSRTDIESGYVQELVRQGKKNGRRYSRIVR